MRSGSTPVWLALFCSSLFWGTPLVEASEARETPLVKAVKRVQLSVVNIHSEKVTDRDTAFHGGGRRVNGMGTGIVVDERGYVVTNQHVIADVETLRCTLSDGSAYTARVISYDRRHDLAIIKIDPTRPLQVMPLGTSSDLMLGETVFAIGNAYGYEHTVTQGIVSYLSRDVDVNEQQSYRNLIQTDASINPGNSGGPLINLDGEVVGINVAIRAGAQRIGFAIPIDDARRFIAKLLNPNRLSDTYHGLVTRDLKGKDMKLVVDTAERGSPAAAAGINTGDIVLQVSSTPVRDQTDLERAFLGRAAGEKVEVLIDRDGNRLTVPVELSRFSTRGNLAAASATGPSPNAIVRANNPESTEEKCWRTLGMKVSKLSPKQLPAADKRYEGGLWVVDVRPNSLAHRSGIRQGDVLVGMHRWATTTVDEVMTIVSHPQLPKNQPLEYFVVRDARTVPGKMPLPQVTASR